MACKKKLKLKAGLRDPDQPTQFNLASEKRLLKGACGVEVKKCGQGKGVL